MSKKEIIERLIAVYNTLDTIEVSKGRVNITGMAGCIQIVQDILQGLATDADEKESANEE